MSQRNETFTWKVTQQFVKANKSHENKHRRRLTAHSNSQKSVPFDGPHVNCLQLIFKSPDHRHVFSGGQRNRNRVCLPDYGTCTLSHQNAARLLIDSLTSKLAIVSRNGKERLQCMGWNKLTASQHERKFHF